MYNLEALKTYYPQGMIKTQPGDNQEFAKNINKLLTNQELYNETRDAALSLIRTVWDWNRRAEYMENVFLTND